MSDSESEQSSQEMDEAGNGPDQKVNEAKNSFGAIFAFDLRGRQPFTKLYARPASSTSWTEQPFECPPEPLRLPDEGGEESGPHGQHYLWIGLLPSRYDEYDRSKKVKEVVREKEKEEKERKDDWVNTV